MESLTAQIDFGRTLFPLRTISAELNNSAEFEERYQSGPYR
jgi:hypothetical protein